MRVLLGGGHTPAAGMGWPRSVSGRGYGSATLTEEHAVPLPPKHGEHGFRSLQGIGKKLEAPLSRGPLDESMRLQEVPFELIVFIVQVEHLNDVPPADVEGDRCRYRRITPERMQVIPEVSDLQVGHLQSSSAVPLVERHRVFRDARHPEQAAGRNPRVVVVALMVEVYLTFIKVQSDEAERAVMAVAVFADVEALHEAHVGLEE